MVMVDKKHYKLIEKDGTEVWEIKNKYYEKQLAKLQFELVKLQAWVKKENKKVVIIFEGRDAAGKGGVIKRIIAPLNPRVCRVEALPVPTDKEKTQWFFQRYVAKLPAAGEIVLFDRSWYNRAGVEKVMGFCSEDEYKEFMGTCPDFERMLIGSGIVLIKYYFNISDEEQERRFQDRLNDPMKRWKFSPMDIKSREKWVEYSKAAEAMFEKTDIPEARWHIVNADIKKHARLNCISHLLSMLPYEDHIPEKMKLPPRREDYETPEFVGPEKVPEIFGGDSNDGKK
ncbi:MAG: polyphosphate kinase 2 [Clostridia bacterium]|nr:polyphosphate kinase 2 [Clostridia bacterium]